MSEDVKGGRSHYVPQWYESSFFRPAGAGHLAGLSICFESELQTLSLQVLQPSAWAWKKQTS